MEMVRCDDCRMLVGIPFCHIEEMEDGHRFYYCEFCGNKRLVALFNDTVTCFMCHCSSNPIECVTGTINGNKVYVCKPCSLEGLSLTCNVCGKVAIAEDKTSHLLCTDCHMSFALCYVERCYDVVTHFEQSHMHMDYAESGVK